MTDQEIKDLVASLAVAQAKTDAQMAKTDAQMAKTAAQMAKTDAQMAKTRAEVAREISQWQHLYGSRIDKLAKLYGGVSESQGSAAEEFFFNSLRANPTIGGIKYDRVTPHLVVGKPGRQSEFDLVLVNGNSVALIEVKHKAHVSAIAQLEAQMRRYRELFPEHASYKLYGGIAGLSVPADTVDEAHQRGLFVLKQQGDVFAVDAAAMRAY